MAVPRGGLCARVKWALLVSILLHAGAAVAIMLMPRSTDTPDDLPPSMQMIFETLQPEEAPQKADEPPSPEPPPPEPPAPPEPTPPELPPPETQPEAPPDHSPEQPPPEQPPQPTPELPPETPPLAQPAPPEPAPPLLPSPRMEPRPPKPVHPKVERPRAPPVSVPSLKPSEPDAAERPATTSAAQAPVMVDNSWRSSLAAWIRSRRHYPAEARRQRMQGIVSVRVVVARDGQITNVQIVHGSGSDMLDQAAVAMFRGAQAPAFPGDMASPQINITLSIRYYLDDN